MRRHPSTPDRSAGRPRFTRPDVAAFWGVHTSFAFDAVQIRETTGGNDNEIFGTFHTGLTAVPEPATLFLLGAGLAAGGVRRYRRRT